MSVMVGADGVVSPPRLPDLLHIPLAIVVHHVPSRCDTLLAASYVLVHQYLICLFQYLGQVFMMSGATEVVQLSV